MEPGFPLLALEQQAYAKKARENLITGLMTNHFNINDYKK